MKTQHAICVIRRDQYSGKVLESDTYPAKSKADAVKMVKETAKFYRAEFSAITLSANSYVGIGGIEIRYEVNGEAYSPPVEQD